HRGARRRQEGGRAPAARPRAARGRPDRRRPSRPAQGGAAAVLPAGDGEGVTAARTLIVNADDFGLTPGVSRGILEAGAKGIVTSTTVLVNRPTDPDLIARLEASGLGAGLHLNLTLGTPISNPRRVPSLVDGEGRFIRDPREAASRADKDEARIELGNQIDVFRALMGRFPTHLD